MNLRVGQRSLDGPGPFLMGVVNVTPDSFADGGRYLDPVAAIAHGKKLLAEGAHLLDVGGESTRPGAPPVPAEEEIARVVPVIAALAGAGAAISVDTMKASVAEAALAAGAGMVNDVRGLADPALAEVVARAKVPVVLMHMRGLPVDMQERAGYRDVVSEVRAELGEAMARARSAGIAEECIVLDPGLGFAKTAEHNLELLRRLGELRGLGRPLLVGPSRKSFIGRITGAPVEARLAGTLAAVAACVLAGVEIVRVHDVAAAREAALVAAAIRDGKLPPHPG